VTMGEGWRIEEPAGGFDFADDAGEAIEVAGDAGGVVRSARYLRDDGAIGG